MMRLSVKIALIFLAVSVVLILIISRLGSEASRSKFAVLEPVVKEQQVAEIQQVKDDIRIVFVGDIMLSRGIGRLMATTSDWTYPFQYVADFLRSADITFGNLEGPISDRGTNIGSIYSFRADPKSVEGLVHAGFDIVSFANNHVWDYGRDAFTDTLQILENNGIAYTGAGLSFDDAHKPVIIEVKGTRVAFLAYTNLLPASLGARDSKPAVAFPDGEQMMLDIQSAKSLANIVIVSFHFGDEYKTIHNAFQERIAHTAIDAGADFVVGHHPHVAEDVEIYKGKYIAYSLGNFVFDQNFSEDTSWGLVHTLIIKDKKVVALKEQRASFNDTYQPMIGDEVVEYELVKDN